MAYVDPNKVNAPKRLVSDVQVVFDTHEIEGSWSVALLKWDGRETVGMRWNGDPSNRGIGTPQARGVPTWFIVPEELQDAILEKARELADGGQTMLKAGYEQMARDKEREREAGEWSEGLIGDPAHDKG
jgi:enoyl-CoA hydratase/carnithine racemase